MRDSQTHQRLEQLYEISQLFARTADVEETFPSVLEIVGRTLPLRSAILMKAGASRPTMIIWPTAAHDSERLRPIMAQVETAYASLVAAATPTRDPGGPLSAQVIVIPLVVAHRPPFGVLLLEGAQSLDDTDLIFVNAIASQFAIAFERDHARQRDITRREHAEEGRTHAEERRALAEVTGATSERERISAERSSEKFEALAGENARLYEEAKQAVHVRDELLAIVSHDLRSPLWAILMTADDLAAGGDLAKGADRIRRSATRMMRLIEDLLDFASIAAGRLAVRRQPQDPDPMLLETFASFEGVAHEKGLTLTLEVEPHLPKIHCDGGRILQVFSNLVGNAIRVTARGGQIILRAAARAGEVLFSVADNGPGISEENIQHLFERYWRGNDAAYKGSGLGLAIAGGIVSAHGGRIWAESTPGLGATFHFTIPTADVTFLFAVPASAEDAPSPREDP